ncbi:hypothetical protein A6A08_16540 [Nocardiopsis sp. TSRI0078]|uniref:hypothetical protein n=1 Tax=unclassified Nocardiopsis TaxID=2649073 RepID=UPI00093F9EBC|nr:hypothetical protein [Nocardiopsis sp. TSRI0078]OKI13045.1 hypothetical protein A6A08_16540 [Nocardiopsis sp. TSRI0078]
MISTTRASTAVLFVDACREGFEEATARSAVSKRRRWSRGTIALASRRKWAYVFSRGVGEYSRFITDSTGGSMSASSAALCTTLHEDGCPGDAVA